MKTLLGVLSVALLTLCLSACGEKKETYIKRAVAVADSIKAEAGYNYAVAEMATRVWHNAIFNNEMTDPLTGEKDGRFCSDFNAALKDYYDGPLVKAVKPDREKGKKKLDSLYITIKEAPSDAQGTLSGVKDLYASYEKMYNLTWEPTGSLQSYREAVADVNDKVGDLYTKLKMDAK